MEEIKDYEQPFVAKNKKLIEECPICFEEMEVDSNEPVVRLEDCHHHYHLNCLHDWYTTSHTTHCPICRVCPVRVSHLPIKTNKVDNSTSKQTKKRSFCCIIC